MRGDLKPTEQLQKLEFRQRQFQLHGVTCWVAVTTKWLLLPFLAMMDVGRIIG